VIGSGDGRGSRVAGRGWGCLPSLLVSIALSAVLTVVLNVALRALF
jgi:hypothetical protein